MMYRKFELSKKTQKRDYFLHQERLTPQFSRNAMQCNAQTHSDSGYIIHAKNFDIQYYVDYYYLFIFSRLKITVLH